MLHVCADKGHWVFAFCHIRMYIFLFFEKNSLAQLPTCQLLESTSSLTWAEALQAQYLENRFALSFGLALRSVL